MLSSGRILIGLGAGVTVGGFLAERAVVFSGRAEAFVTLLQMTVGLRAGAVLLALWAMALASTKGQGRSIERRYGHWVLGRDALPRWSIIRDVRHRAD